MLELRTLLKTVRRLESQRGVGAPGQCLTVRDVVKLRQRQNQAMSPVDATWLRIQLEAIISGRSAQIGPYDGVDGAWAGQPCFLVAGSRGLKNAMDQGFRLDMLDGFHSIGVNHVVEDYHRFEWLFFMDRRLLEISRWDILREYQGRIFAHIKTRLTPGPRTTIIYTQNDGPAEHIIQGLFSFVVSGVTAINLALISGARPIYLLGLDNGGCTNNQTSTHYKDSYTGEKVGQGNWQKFLRAVPEMLLAYAPWADRFVNVDPLGDITVFPKMGVREIPELARKFA